MFRACALPFCAQLAPEMMAKTIRRVGIATVAFGALFMIRRARRRTRVRARKRRRPLIVAPSTPADDLRAADHDRPASSARRGLRAVRPRASVARTVVCADALGWLQTAEADGAAAVGDVVTSPPDASELELAWDEYVWLERVVARLLERLCAGRRLLVLYLSDARDGGAWRSEGGGRARAGRRRPTRRARASSSTRSCRGTTSARAAPASLGRPRYSHLLAFRAGAGAHGRAGCSRAPSADVLDRRRDAVGARDGRGRGVAACALVRAAAELGDAGDAGELGAQGPTRARRAVVIDPFCGRDPSPPPNEAGLYAAGVEIARAAAALRLRVLRH